MSRLAVVAALVLVSFTVPAPALAHCDTMKGPVITSAQAALDAGDPKLVLHWVRPDDEAAITRAFDEAMKVRALGPEAKALADRSFFETLVRIHRAGEGAPYTGIKEGEPEPIIAATDRALETGSATELEAELLAAVRSRLAEQFTATREARSFRPGDVAAGQKYVAAYVPFTHWVEGVYLAAQGPAAHHGAPAAHGASVHAGANGHGAPESHGAGGDAGSAHASHAGGNHNQHVQWLLIGGLGLVAVIQGGLLLRRRGK